MLFNFVTVVPFLLAPATAGTIQRRAPASPCPSGTTFRNTTSYALIGAKAKDIADLTNDYFKPEWSGLQLRSQTGTDNVIGATRGVSQIGGDVIVVERLDEGSVAKPDGSFVQKYSQILKDGKPQILVPAGQPGGPIGLNGYWNTWSVTQLGPSSVPESFVSWNEYRCDIGTPFGSAAFQGYAINSTISLLKSQGKLSGYTIYPVAVEYAN